MSRIVKIGTRRGLRHGAGQRLPSRRRLCVCFTFLLLAGAGLLGGLVYLLTAKPHLGGSWLKGDLPRALELPSVAAPAALLLALFCGWCVRKLRLEWLAWWPGDIEVADLKAPASEEKADVGWLTSELRSRLALLSLQAPTPVPGAAAEGSYLEVLGDKSLDVRNPLSLLRLAPAVWPSRAYRVRATLTVEGSASQPLYLVRAEVTQLSRGSTSAVCGQGRSWEQAIHQAADEATAAILPQTRLCRRQWRSWRGYVMPGGLLPAYERAVEHESRAAGALDAGERHREYLSALRCYHETLDLDTFNLAVRLRMGQLQEKMGRLVEALATYQAIVTVTHPAGVSLPRNLYRRRARMDRAMAITIARYRRAVLLGCDGAVAQWLDGQDRDELMVSLGMLIAAEARQHGAMLVWEPEKASGRGHAKRRLAAPSFSYGLTLDGLSARLQAGRSAEQAVEDLMCKGRSEQIGARQRLVLQALLAALGYATSQRLLHDRGVRWLLADTAVHRRIQPYRLPAAAPFTLQALRLSQLCIQLRLAHALAGLDASLSDWAKEERAVCGRVRELVGGRLRQWHEGYNAACACAIPLLYPQPACEQELAGAAVMWLERATACADSAYVAGQNEWLRKDPDLAGARDTPDYEAWRSAYFPDPPAAPQPPPDPQPPRA